MKCEKTAFYKTRQAFNELASSHWQEWERSNASFGIGRAHCGCPIDSFVVRKVGRSLGDSAKENYDTAAYNHKQQSSFVVVMLQGGIVAGGAGVVNFLGFSKFDNFVAWCSIRLVYLSILLTIAYAYGYIHRFLWFLAERECTKLVNGVPVTFGGVASVDLLRGKFTLINIIFHSPNRKLWKSPIVARIGRADIHVNAIQCVFSLWFLGEEIPIDFYSVHLSDIQVFVERKANVYNFFLLDPNIILPPAFVELNASATNDFNNNASASSTPTSAATSSPKHESSTKETEETAAALVDDMLDAVKRAAAEGSAHGLVSHYRDRLYQSLRTFETTKTTDALIQTVDLLQNVGMNISHKTELAQQVVLPTRRPNPHIVYGRIGTLQVHSLRIFLQDTPIFVPKFCPNTEFTNAFLPMDDVMDTLVKRLVAVVAKSNSSQFLQTAMQEMADALTER